MNLVFGIAGDQLLFVEESRARELAALWKAETWGELKRTAPSLYGEVIELLREAAEWSEDEDEPLMQPKSHST